jgi:hypothetical protein
VSHFVVKSVIFMTIDIDRKTVIVRDFVMLWNQSLFCFHKIDFHADCILHKQKITRKNPISLWMKSSHHKFTLNFKLWHLLLHGDNLLCLI